MSDDQEAPQSGPSKAVVEKASDFHEKAVECARAQVALENARRNERNDPDAVFPAAKAYRQAEVALRNATDALMAAHVEALRPTT